MKLIKTAFLFTALILFSATSRAAVMYDFAFSDINNGYADFSISLTYSDYVTSTGMAAAPNAPHATPFGYSVNYAGTNIHGSWGFDDDTGSVIDDGGFSFGGDAFYFSNLDANPYVTVAGIYNGILAGPSIFGTVVLTVTDVPVPEPSIIALFAIGIFGIGYARRRQS